MPDILEGVDLERMDFPFFLLSERFQFLGDGCFKFLKNDMGGFECDEFFVINVCIVAYSWKGGVIIGGFGC